MNNEEKILALLEKHDAQFDKINATLETMRTDVAGLKTDVADLKDRVVKIEITQENVVIPNMRTLAEGIAAINEKLISRSEFDAVKEELAFLKDIIRMHTSQINELKKAQ